MTVRLLEYADSNLGREDAISGILDAFNAYFESESKSFHSYEWFIDAPHKWFAKKPEVIPPSPFDLPQQGRTMSNEEVFDQTCLRIQENPERWMRGFCVSSSIIKSMNPELYGRIKCFVLEFYGEERAKTMFIKAKKDWGKACQM